MEGGGGDEAGVDDEDVRSRRFRGGILSLKELEEGEERGHEGERRI